MNREGSQKRMLPKPYYKFSRLSTTSTAGMSSTEVSSKNGRIRQDEADPLIDLKPENLIYLTSDPDSDLVLADFGIAKMLDTKDEVLTTMAGSFGYAAPEVMLKKGHGKPVDMWSLGVITYTLLCGYSPFRSENLQDLIEECSSAKVIFHERYWKDVSDDAKNFINTLLQPNPDNRATSSVSLPECPFSCGMLTPIQEALEHPWLSGKNATEHNLLPEIRAYMAKARLRRGIEIIKLANRIEALKMHEDEEDETPDEFDGPADSKAAASDAVVGGHSSQTQTDVSNKPAPAPGAKRSLSAITKRAIFREIVLAKVREMKEEEQAKAVEAEAKEHAKTKSFQS